MAAPLFLDDRQIERSLAGSAIISTWTIFPRVIVKRSTLDNWPPGAHTSPTAPSTSIGGAEALLVVLDRHTPAERIAFVLHDMSLLALAKSAEQGGVLPHPGPNMKC